MSSRQPLGADDQAQVNQLIERGTATLTEGVVDEMSRDDLEKAAYVKTHLRVVKHKFSGGCARALTGCPSGWKTTDASACSPPDDYDGLCGAIDFSKHTMEEKEALAWKCRAVFPCSEQRVNATLTERAEGFARQACACPEEWSHKGSQLCVAPGSYSGRCSPATSFEGVSEAQKEWWSKRCDAPWSCLGRQSSSSKRLVIDGLAEELAQEYPAQPKSAIEKALADALTLSAQREQLSLVDLFFAGSATPDYELPCPEGWALDLVHDCFAPSSYTGPCVRRKAFNKYNFAEKEEWAKICGVTWPSPASSSGRDGVASDSAYSGKSCAPNYAKECPAQWVRMGRYCRAPEDYKGPCGLYFPSTGFAIDQKRAFAVACNAPWQCE